MMTSRATNIVICYHGLRVVHLVKGHADMNSCITIAEESDIFGLSSGRHEVFYGEAFFVDWYIWCGSRIAGGGSGIVTEAIIFCSATFGVERRGMLHQNQREGVCR